VGFWILAAVVMVCSAWFRWQFIELKPVHTDEAENAYLLAKDLEGDVYVFNPRHHHGPTLNLWLHVPAAIAGFEGFADMQIGPLRTGMWALGVLTLAGMLLLKQSLPREAVLAAMLLAGSSGYLTYYGNEVIHETLLGALVLAMLILMAAFAARPNLWKAVGIGCVAGFMFATKITSLFYFASWGIGALLLAVYFRRRWRCHHTLATWVAWTLVVMISALVVSTLLYTGFFRNPAGIRDAVSSLWQYETESGHEKPWSYFLTQLVLPLNRAPFGSYETGLWVFSGIGSVVICSRRFASGLAESWRWFGWFLLISTSGQILLYSLVSYKTPWLLLSTWLQVALLAGIGFTALWRSRRVYVKWVAVTALLILTVLQLRTSYQLNAVRHSDPRNPLAYAPTSANIERLPVFLKQQWLRESLAVAAAAGSGNENAKLAVYGSFIWPLPWYLRAFPQVHYAPHAPSIPDDTVFILTDTSYAEVDPAALETCTLHPYTLRPNVPVYLCVRKPLTPAPPALEMEQRLESPETSKN